jgi:hypothetical protein
VLGQPAVPPVPDRQVQLRRVRRQGASSQAWLTQCPDTHLCTGGACTPCPSGQTACGGDDPFNPSAKCVNTRSDHDNCGGCGYAVSGSLDTLTQCAYGATCDNGVCKCPAGQSVCGGDIVTPPGGNRGGCQDLRNDRQHCGACWNYVRLPWPR